MNDLDLLVELFAKAGKPVVENRTPGKEVVIKPPSFVVDASWLSANVSAAKNKQALRDLIFQIENTGIDRQYSVENFAKFVQQLNQVMVVPANSEKLPISQMLSRVNIVRVLHNMAETKAGRQSAAGFSFENFLAIFFKDGAVVPTTEKDNIADVTLGAGQQASIKFLSGYNATVGGSIPDFLKTIETYGHIDYIVGIKKGGEIEFLYTRILGETLDKLSPEEKIKKGKVTAGELSGKSGKLVRRWANYMSGASSVKPTQTQMTFTIKQLKFKSLGTLKTKGALDVAKFLLQGLNSQFNDLLTNLQQLAEKVNELTYAKDEDRKKKASASAEKAEKTKQSAQDIEKDA